MFTTTKFTTTKFATTKLVFAAAVIFSTAFSASAATKPHVSHAPRRPIYDMVPRDTAPSHSDSNEPAQTGGGSLGYNQMLLVD
jgi:hypothetical protein